MSFFFPSDGFLSLCVEALNGDIAPSRFHSLVASLKSTGHLAADPPPTTLVPPGSPPTFQRDDEAFEFDCGRTGSTTPARLAASHLASSSASTNNSTSVSLGLLLLPLPPPPAF